MNKLFLAAIIAISIFATNAFSQESKIFFQTIEGKWQGTLEYQDYTSNRRVTMNTIITFNRANASKF